MTSQAAGERRSAEETLRTMLEDMRALKETLRLPRSFYSCSEDFVLRHGRWYRGPWRNLCQQGVPKKCYGTAIVEGALHGWKYIEGFALDPRGIMAIPHAWNADESDALIDATWLNFGLAYFGVEFSLERADDATWNGDACVLEDFQRRYPLFEQPWAGENYSLVWPPSERLDMVRARDVKAGKKFVREYAASIGKRVEDL